jgi:lipopolysaccharide export system permease protein
MSILDRYLLGAFLRVLCVSFLSLTGLFIVIDLFANLDELLSHAELHGSLAGILVDYYGARVLSFFDRTSGLLALIAAIFIITTLQRQNELTALMAAGIPRARVARPLLAAAALVAMIAAVNREIALPQVRDKLSRNAQDWQGEAAKRLNPRRDHRTQILIGGKATMAAGQRIIQPAFRLPYALSRFGRQLTATQATYSPPTGDRPGGYLLEGVTQPSRLSEIDSATLGDETVLFSPKDHDWLAENQCFVVSDISFELLAADTAWRQYASTAELIRTLHNPSLDYAADMRVALHQRLLRPLLDLTLLLLGLPLVLTRSTHNVFFAIAQCVLLVAVFFLVTLCCTALGNSILVAPALAAWLPLLIFGPLAYVAGLRGWE